jgi:small multidrug resistance family-3 protein
MIATLGVLVVAAVLEVGGDAAIRHGLTRPAWAWLAVGAAALVSYGVVVNTNRAVDFNRLMGTYIVVFFVVSQTIAWACFGERPSAPLLVGGALIVTGGFVIQTGAP